MTGAKVAGVSRVLRILSWIGIVSIPTVIGSIWLLGSERFLLSGETTHYLVPHGAGFEPGTLTLQTRVVAMLISMIPGAVVMIGLWHLAQLFGHFSALNFFTLDTVRHFRVFATSVLLVGLLNPLSGGLLSLATSLGNAPGNRFISFTAGDTELAFIFLGVVLLVIAWVMEQGRRLSDDYQQIV